MAHAGDPKGRKRRDGGRRKKRLDESGDEQDNFVIPALSTYNRWLSDVAYAYKRLPSELLDLPWTHFLLLATPLQEHECNQAMWLALASHAPDRLSSLREEAQAEDVEDDDDYDGNFAQLKELAAKGGVLL